MRDIKASFAANNLTVTGVDWSFVPEVSGETAAEEDVAPPVEAEKGEVTGGAHAAKDVVILDEPETCDDQAAHPDQQQ